MKRNVFVVCAALVMGLWGSLAAADKMGFPTSAPSASSSAVASASASGSASAAPKATPSVSATPPAAKSTVTVADFCATLVTATATICPAGTTASAHLSATAPSASTSASASASAAPAPKPVLWKGFGYSIFPQQKMGYAPDGFVCQDDAYMLVRGAKPNTVVCVRAAQVEAAKKELTLDLAEVLNNPKLRDPKNVKERAEAQAWAKRQLFTIQLLTEGFEDTALKGVLMRHSSELMNFRDEITKIQGELNAVQANVKVVKSDVAAIAVGSCDVEDAGKVTPEEFAERCYKARKANAAELTPIWGFWGGGAPGLRTGPGLKLDLVLGGGPVVALLGGDAAYIHGYETGPQFAGGVHGGIGFWSDSRRFRVDVLGSAYAFSFLHGAGYRGIPGGGGAGYALIGGTVLNLFIPGGDGLAFRVGGEMGVGDLNWYESGPPPRINRGTVPTFKGILGFGGTFRF